MSNTLVLPNVTMEDRGLYRCRAELEPQNYKNSTAKVVVFGEFLPHKRREGQRDRWLNLSLDLFRCRAPVPQHLVQKRAPEDSHRQRRQRRREEAGV